MAKSLRGYVREGLILSEGLSFNLESDRNVDLSFVETHLKGAFRYFRPSLWRSNPVVPSIENGYLGRMEYFLEIDKDVRVSFSKTDNPKGYNFELNIRSGDRMQKVKSEDNKTGEFLEKLFDHVSRYASSAH